jgi:predicted metalloprotease with PDZ domain
MKLICNISIVSICLLLFTPIQAQKMNYTVSMDEPATHIFHVTLHCDDIKAKEVDFKMPTWSPGYYQRLDYAKNLEHFTATDAAGKEIKFEKVTGNTWRAYNGNSSSVILSYDVKTSRMFVANPYLDEERGYIIPAGLFMHIAGKINMPVQVTVKPFAGWKDVATGLQPVPGKLYTYTAPDYDILYDCPLLVSNLEELPAFTVQGISHRFIGYKLGDFDKVRFMNDLKKIVEASVKIIGDIPYKQYTFIGIGPGQGGIEHLNSTTISFRGAELDKHESYIRTLNFIAHEYFHHYNVKRIRPIELGPFNYDSGSRTNQLWISEGLSVYYEYLTVMRAGLSTEDDLLKAIRSNILAYETKPGRLYQSLAQASYETWKDGPFGRSGDEANKTISYYDKGPVVGLLFDFAIRHETNNKHSLDDVMRTLYRTYYQKKKRGFTEEEFKAVVKQVAGNPLSELFEYVYTTKEIDYPKYLAYGGLEIDTASGDRSFQIKHIVNPDALQQAIWNGWMGK